MRLNFWYDARRARGWLAALFGVVLVFGLTAGAAGDLPKDRPARNGDRGLGTSTVPLGLLMDVNRVLMLIAVLARHAGLNLTSHDVYVNVAGGLRIDEPAADLPIAVALASSLRDRPVRRGTVLAGEVALSGRLRAAARAERRLVEARRLGFERLVTGTARGGSGEGGSGLVVAREIREALGTALAD